MISPINSLRRVAVTVATSKPIQPTMVRTIVVLVLAVIFGSHSPLASNAGSKMEPGTAQRPKSKSGLTIETSPTRGIRFSDSLGDEYFIVHVTNTITNDSTIPIDLQIALPIEFISSPISDEYLKFKIALWPGVTEPPHLYSDSQGRVMENATVNDWEASNQFNKLLAPGETYVVTIGTIIEYYEPPLKTCGAVAYSFLEYSDSGNYSDCGWTVEEEHSTNPELALGLQVGFCTSGLHYESCAIITCGHITYVEN